MKKPFSLYLKSDILGTFVEATLHPRFASVSEGTQYAKSNIRATPFKVDRASVS